MNSTLRKIIVNPHVATSASVFLTTVLVNLFNVPPEKANNVIGSAIALMLIVDGILAGTAEGTLPGVETSTTTTMKQVDVPVSAVPPAKDVK